MVFLGSMTKTERMVKAMPLESTLVASWWSILLYNRKLELSQTLGALNLPTYMS